MSFMDAPEALQCHGFDDEVRMMVNELERHLLNPLEGRIQHPMQQSVGQSCPLQPPTYRDWL